MVVSFSPLSRRDQTRRLLDQCLQFWGGMGYASDSEINRIFRDARLTAIGGGADEVMLQILTKMPPERH